MDGQSIEKLEVLTAQFDSREEPFYYLGLLYINVERMDKAKEALESALEINPHYLEAKSQYRHVHRQLKEPQRGKLFQRRKKI